MYNIIMEIALYLPTYDNIIIYNRMNEYVMPASTGLKDIGSPKLDYPDPNPTLVSETTRMLWPLSCSTRISLSTRRTDTTVSSY